MGVGDPNVSKNRRLLMRKARSGKALVRQVCSRAYSRGLAATLCFSIRAIETLTTITYVRFVCRESGWWTLTVLTWMVVSAVLRIINRRLRGLLPLKSPLGGLYKCAISDLIAWSSSHEHYILQVGHCDFWRCLSYCLWLRLLGGSWEWKPQCGWSFSHEAKMSHEQRISRGNRCFVCYCYWGSSIVWLPFISNCNCWTPLILSVLFEFELSNFIAVVYLWLGRRYRYRDELRAMVKNDEVWQGPVPPYMHALCTCCSEPSSS